MVYENYKDKDMIYFKTETGITLFRKMMDWHTKAMLLTVAHH